MTIVRNLFEIESNLSRAVVTIGNFDGVHLGHRKIFQRVRQSAREIGGVSVVITFIPHPLKLLPSRKNIRLITTYAEKESLIRASGVDYLLNIPFTEEFANISAHDFVTRILLAKIGMCRLVIGYDYAFGRNREGDVALLRHLGSVLGFEVEVLEPIGAQGVVYSSSRIRGMIGEGLVREVVSLLGRHFFLDGTIVHGHHRGKGLGFPTANLATDNELIPRQGVYAVKVDIGGRLHDGACNIGSNPTFGDGETAIEVFVFDFEGDLYGSEIRLYFVERIRDEQKFPDADSLKTVIQADVVRCREILNMTTVAAYHEDDPGFN